MRAFSKAWSLSLFCASHVNAMNTMVYDTVLPMFMVSCEASQAQRAMLLSPNAAERAQHGKAKGWLATSTIHHANIALSGTAFGG